MRLSDTWKDKQDGVDDILAVDFNSVAHNVIDLQDNPARAVTADISFTGITTSNDANATISDKTLSTAVDGTTFTIAYKGEVEFDFLINTSGVSVSVDGVLLKTTTAREQVTYIGNVQSSIKLSAEKPFSCIAQVFNGVKYEGGIIAAKDYESLIKIPMLEKQIVQLQKPAGTAFKSYSVSEKVTYSQGVIISENRIDADPGILGGGQVIIALSGYWRFETRFKNVSIYVDGNEIEPVGRKISYEGYITNRITVSVRDNGFVDFLNGLEERIFEGGIVSAEDYEKFVLLQETSQKMEKALEEKANKNEVSNVLKGHKIGEVVSLDVSPFEHEISAKISSKNLCDNIWEKGTIHASTGVLVNQDSAIRTVNYITLIPGCYYTLSKVSFTANTVYSRFFDNDENFTGSGTNLVTGTSITFIPKENQTKLKICIGGIIDKPIENPIVQVEKGTAATTYTPIVTDISSAKLVKALPDGTTEIFTPDKNGNVTGILSVYPETKLYSDMAGVLVEANYNRDINKAFAELQNAMISLGGNI